MPKAITVLLAVLALVGSIGAATCARPTPRTSSFVPSCT